MRRLLLLVVVFSLMCVAGNTFAQTKHVLTKYGDDVGTLDGIIKAYYDVVTIKKGEKINFERDSLLHIADVRVGSTGMSNGKTVLHFTTLKQYHKESDAYMERNGFYEREVSRKIDNVGSIYHVWSTYKTWDHAGGKIIGQGTNSIELFYDGNRFWILGWFYD